MPIITKKRNGDVKHIGVLTIPEKTTIVLTPEECLRILKSANDVIRNNPINVERIINVMHMSGEASKLGMDPSDVILSEMVKCHDAFVKKG